MPDIILWFYLVRRAVLDDLGAEIGALDGSQILLIGFSVACVLVEHVRSPSLDLRVNDGGPQGLSLHLRKYNFVNTSESDLCFKGNITETYEK
jgi:hypothetical protein